MKKMLFVFAIAATFNAVAQSGNKQQEYIQKYSDLAIKEMMRTGVPAAITLAQGILETESGQSELVKNTNNHFGIKCKTEWTGATYLHDDDAKGECFRSYTSAEDSYRDHSDFLKNRPYYTFLFKLDPTDYEGWAKGLKKAGYATESRYAQMLIGIIVANQLQQYTLVALQKMNNKDELWAANNNAPKEPATTVSNTLNNSQNSVALFPDEENQPAEKETPAAPRGEQFAKVAQTVVAAPAYPTGEFKINATRVIYAQAGTSLFALANNNNISFNKLLDFNELDKIDILEKDQLIFLEKKPKKGENDFHVVGVNETIIEISQKEGVNLKSLLEYNRIGKNMQPAVGEKIYLKSTTAKAPRLTSKS